MTSIAYLACLILAGAALLFAAGCRDSSQPRALPTTGIQIGSEHFTIEIANTDATRTRGLMKRDSMPSDHGMIFVFDDEASRGFWMRDTRIPLDIIFIDASGKVVSIHSMKPYDLRSTFSEGPAKYAIELNQGIAAKTGIKPGDEITIPPEAREPARQ